MTQVWRRWDKPHNSLLTFIDELWKTPKISDLKKWKKILLEMSSFCTCLPKTTIIWGTVPKIQSEINLFCHFGPFFVPPPLSPILTTRKPKFGKHVKKIWRCYPFTYMHHKSWSYDVWFARYKVQKTKFFCHYGPYFALWLS